MRLDTSQQMRTEMRLRMAPRMIQSMEILQLHQLALQERIDQELIENPVLEIRETTPADLDPDETPPASDDRDDLDEFPELTADFAETYAEAPRLSRNALDDEADRKHDAMQNMASRPQSLHDYLDDQLGFLDLSPTERALARYIIHNLDDHGFLPLDLAEVVRDCGVPATLEEAEQALAQVQRLDPPGIAARDLKECLLLQLTPEVPCADVLRVLISHHLDDLQQNRLPAVQKKTGFDLDTIKEALHQLRRLEPRPGARFSTDPAQYVVPDLIVEPDEHGHYQVRLLDDHTPQLSISRHYQKLLKTRRADPVTRDFIQKKIQSARWLIESIEQRRNTLLKVARAIVERQQAFLDHGPEHIQPLKMQQIADVVHVHVTTVSRAVDDKWVQTPRGVYALKSFFGGGTTTASGEEVAWETIKQKLLEVIDREDKRNPLSDEELVDALAEHGLPVARRTVTKYRKALRIPSSRQRRQF
jgi:RNA polymerase sigma-54 factor